jgi:hypothetical protein
MNAWRHGERSAEAIEERALLATFLRLLREEAAEEREAARWIDLPPEGWGWRMWPA